MKLLISGFSIILLVSLACGRSFLRGEDGEPGRMGPSCTSVQTENGGYVTCPDGSGIVILNGKQGDKGDAGSTGSRGDTGATGSAGNDGTNGNDGLPGVDAPVSSYTITSVIDPCGAGAGYNEVLLKLGNGQVMSHFTEGSREYLTILKPGNYITGDTDACYFTIDADNNVVGEHH